MKIAYLGFVSISLTQNGRRAESDSSNSGAISKDVNPLAAEFARLNGCIIQGLFRSFGHVKCSPITDITGSVCRNMDMISRDIHSFFDQCIDVRSPHASALKSIGDSMSLLSF